MEKERIEIHLELSEINKQINAAQNEKFNDEYVDLFDLFKKRYKLIKELGWAK